jgi:hypothetical protein
MVDQGFCIPLHLIPYENNIYFFIPLEGRVWQSTLIVDLEDAPLPTLDSTRLLARAALQKAMAA